MGSRNNAAGSAAASNGALPDHGAGADTAVRFSGRSPEELPGSKQNRPLLDQETVGQRGLQRHDLVFLTPFAAEQMQARTMPETAEVGQEITRLLKAGVPAIVKAQTGQGERGQDGIGQGEALLELGISAPHFRSGTRLRYIFFATKAQIQECLDPAEVLERLAAQQEGEIHTGSNGTPNRPRFLQMLQFMQVVKREAHCCGLQTGIYGSAALEGLTGLPYLHEQSDLDLYFYPIKQFAADRLPEFCCWLDRHSQKAGVCWDGEISIGRGDSAKLKELVGNQNQRTVLVKGSNGPYLLARETALTRLNRYGGTLSQ